LAFSAYGKGCINLETTGPISAHGTLFEFEREPISSSSTLSRRRQADGWPSHARGYRLHRGRHATLFSSVSFNVPHGSLATEMDILIATLRVQIARLTWRSLLQAGLVVVAEPAVSADGPQQGAIVAVASGTASKWLDSTAVGGAASRQR
jgi:hypothetical protein